MEYKIISGRTEEIRRVMMDRGRQHFRRNTRIRKKSSLLKIMQNEREAVKRLARVLNCNFDKGDLWITLSYPEEMLPEDWTEAEKRLRQFLRKLKRAYEKATGEKLRYVYSHGRKGHEGEDVRIHHHLVLPAMPYELITSLWPADDVTYRRLDGRGDYTGVARYMIQNAGHDIPGAQKYHPSRGLAQPIYTEPVPVSKEEKRQRIRVPGNVSFKAREEYTDEETGMMSEYVRYTRPRKGTRGEPSEADRRGRGRAAE